MFTCKGKGNSSSITPITMTPIPLADLYQWTNRAWWQ